MTYEALLRGGAFAALLVGLLLLERRYPRRPAASWLMQRRITNLVMVMLSTVLIRLVAPIATVGWALWAQQRGWGLFAQLHWPGWVEITLGVLALDMIIYWQHRLMHRVPLLWRLHRMHHSDVDFDVSTGVRFHPLEYLLSLGVKGAAVIALGASPLAALIFELLLSLTSLWEHANLRLPRRVDTLLRSFSVTPDMHRVHHSVVREETNSNFGFNLPWWDYLFRSYTAVPRAGIDGMTIGLPQFREQHDQNLLALLVQPLRNPSP